MKKVIALILTTLTSLSYAQTELAKDDICLYPDVKATYPAGQVALYDFLMTHYKLDPSMEIVNDNEIVVRLVVEKDGSYKIEGMKKMSAECLPCNEELIRVISRIERFNPGQKEGKPVRSILDIHFTLVDVLDSEMSTLFSSHNVAPPSANQQETDIYTIVDEDAYFPGGRAAMMKFLASNIKYPAEAVKNKIEGKVYLKFIVEKTGELTDIKVVKGMPNCPECEKEAISVLRRMPKWKPAKVNGKEVRSEYYLPIVFKL